MNKLIQEANELLKNGGFDYAFCGGQGLDLFLGYESRVHGDIDVCAFWEDRDRIIRYMQAQGFEVYEMLGGGTAAGRIVLRMCPARSGSGETFSVTWRAARW